MDIRQAETRSPGKFTGTAVELRERAYHRCLVGLLPFVRTGTGFEMKFPIVAHCPMPNSNCKRKWCQAQTA
jgi:hypothetical protein